MKRTNNYLTAAAAALTVSLLMAGCSQSANTDQQPETGTMILSVNPEIRITYDENGNVTKLDGMNTDGEGIVTSYQDYVGKDCRTVLDDLVAKIHEAGYFIEDLDGNPRNIILQFEQGSVMPEQEFQSRLQEHVQTTAGELTLTSDVIVIDDDDYHEKSSDSSSTWISLDKAKEIALAQANVDAGSAKFDDREFDFENGAAVYELEFYANGIEYEYDIDARTGKVIKAGHRDENSVQDTDYGEGNDGVTDYHMTDYGIDSDGYTDYGNTDYGPNNDGVTDYNDTDYGPNNDGVTDYNDTDYGPNNDGVTDYDDTDYGPNNDGVTDYNDTDYGPNNDGVTDYSVPVSTPAPTPVPTPVPAPVQVQPAPAPAQPAAPVYSGDSGYSNYGGDSGYSNYGDSGYDD